MKFFWRCLFGLALGGFVFFRLAVSVGADIGSSQVKIPEKASPQQLEIFLQSVQQQVRDSGIVNFRPYSDLLVREARKAVARRDFESAELFARYACRLSPDLPIGYLVHALAQWAGNKFMVHRLGAGYWSACLAATRDMESLSFVTASILTCVVAAFLLTLTVFAGIAVVKLFSRALHDMAHFMPDAVPFAVKRGLTAVLFVAPLFAGMSLPATALYWLVLLFGYCGTRERIAICGFGAGCAVLPAAVGAICFCLYLPQSEIVGTLWRVNYGYWTSATIDHLEDISQRQPDDIDVLMTLGLAHKREQNYRTARRYYEKAMAAAPRNYKTHVNIGNVFLATGRWEQAVAAYREAAALAPTASAAAHFNLARAYQQRFMFKEAEQELFAAKRIAADRIDRQLGLYSENYNRMLLDELPGRSNLLLRGYRDFLRESQITAGVWALLFPGISLQYAPAFFLGIVFFCLISVRRDRVRIAVSCRFCGKTMCRRCQVQLTDEIGCNQCRNFFHKKERIGARAKAEKMKQILRHRNMRSVPGNVLAVCLPGAGHMWKGQVLRGSLYLFVFLCFMGRCVGLVVWENPADVAGVLGLSALSVWGGGCFVLWCCLAADGARIKVSEVDDILLK